MDGCLTYIHAVGNITDPRGYLWAVTPGVFTHYHQHYHNLIVLHYQYDNLPYSGFQPSCTPRCGDASCTAQMHGMVRRHGESHSGFENLWRGTDEIKTMRVLDYGYVYEDRNTVAANLRNGNPDVATATAQVLGESMENASQRTFQLNSVLVYPFRAGTKYITFNAGTHRATFMDDDQRAHLASYVNAARVGTYLRGGVEQYHGAIVQTNKVRDQTVQTDYIVEWYYRVICLKESKCFWFDQQIPCNTCSTTSIIQYCSSLHPVFRRAASLGNRRANGAKRRPNRRATGGNGADRANSTSCAPAPIQFARK
jgi:hypothetical protein